VVVVVIIPAYNEIDPSAMAVSGSALDGDRYRGLVDVVIQPAPTWPVTKTLLPMGCGGFCHQL